MTDSPMIRVLKYLEAGNDLILPKDQYRARPLVVRFYGGYINCTEVENIHDPPQFWDDISQITLLTHYAQYLPVEPEKPAQHAETRHVRKVEL